MIHRLQQRVEATVPKGWKTAYEWAMESGLSRSQASRLLREGEKKGMIERKMFRTKLSDGLVRPCPYYKFN
jgi:DNA-binding MarR family transcriptional regulator